MFKYCVVCGKRHVLWFLCNEHAVDDNPHVVEKRHRLFDLWRRGGDKAVRQYMKPPEEHWSEEH